LFPFAPKHTPPHGSTLLNMAPVFIAITLRYCLDMASIVRRSRMRRTHTGKRIELTARDLEIFRVLARYRYLPSTYIHAFVGGASQTRFKERLGDLFHEGYLNRPERQWEMANCRHRPVVHEIGAGARRVLEAQGVAEQARTWLGASAHVQFSHSSMICELLASIELGTRQRPSMRFIPWPEVLAKAPAETRALAVPFRFPATAASPAIVPDGLFGIEYGLGSTKSYRFFALEGDRGTMPVMRSNHNQTSYLGKIAAYCEIIAKKVHKSHLGVPNLLVLTVTTSDARAADIIGRLRGQAGCSSAFLFKAVEVSSLANQALGLLFDPWERSGHPPLRIDE
jgi:hypothetical protein